METLIQDLRYGARMLLKSPVTTLIAAISLALGIGANTTIYTLINGILLQRLPFQDPERVVSVFTTDEKNKGDFNDFSPMSKPNYEDYRDRNQVFTGMAFSMGIPLNLSGQGKPEQIFGEIASGNFFDVLGVQPLLGRTFLKEEDKGDGSGPVVVLSDGAFQRRFGGDKGVVGRTMTLNGQPFTIVGVAPPGFSGMNAIGGPELWMPISMHQQVLTGFLAENYNDRRALIYNIVARLKPGVTQDQAKAELNRIGSQLEKEYPVPNGSRNATLLPAAQSMLNPGFRRLFVMAGGLLMTVVGLVLLIACANVANLLLARAEARRKEIALRLSLGASRGRLVRQLLTESLLLALVGGGAGLLIAYWSKDLIIATRPQQFFPANLDIGLDGRVLLFTLLISLATGVLFGLAPALQATRTNLSIELKDRTSQPAGGRRRPTLRGALVVAQVALSLVALIGAGLFLRSLDNTQHIDPGFETEKLIVVTFDLGAQGYDRPRAEEFYRRAQERAASIHGVRSTTLSNALPIGGGGFFRTVFPEGHEPSAGSTGTFVMVETIVPGYLDAMGVKLLAGRDLTDADREMAPMAVLFNETAAKKFWPEGAIGKRFKFFGDPEFREVVGVVETTKVFTLGEDPRPVAYVPLQQAFETAMTLHLLTDSDPKPLLETVRREIQALDPNLPLTAVQTVGQLLDQSLWAPRMGAALLTIFGLLALLLASLGIYGVMSYSVSQRTHEFGVRMALGAKAGDVLSLVLKQGVVMVAAGLLIGLLAAFALTRFVGAMLVGVGTTDPVTFLGIAVILLGVTVFASFLPARRATRVDPMVALRYE